MTNEELAILLINHDSVAWVVLHLQDLVLREQDPDAERVWKKICQRRLGISEVPREILDSPVFVKESAVAHIIPIVSFLKRYDEEALVGAGLSKDVATDYAVSFSSGGKTVGGNAAKLILILRNALSHFSDYLAGEGKQQNVAFDKGLVRFWSKPQQEVMFNNAEGWLKFLKDCHRAVYHIVRERHMD